MAALIRLVVEHHAKQIHAIYASIVTQLHRSFGFQPVGVYRAVAYKRGAWHDSEWYQLKLQAHAPTPTVPVVMPRSPPPRPSPRPLARARRSSAEPRAGAHDHRRLARRDPHVYNILVTWLVTAVSLLIITQLKLGITVDSIGSALIAALAIGLVNAILGPILGILTLPLTILTLGLFALVVNALLFWLAAGIVTGFRLRNGFWSALLGSILLTVVNTVIFWLLNRVGIV